MQFELQASAGPGHAPGALGQKGHQELPQLEGATSATSAYTQHFIYFELFNDLIRRSLGLVLFSNTRISVTQIVGLRKTFSGDSKVMLHPPRVTLGNQNDHRPSDSFGNVKNDVNRYNRLGFARS